MSRRQRELAALEASRVRQVQQLQKSHLNNRARAIALPRQLENLLPTDDQWLMMLHALLALLIPFLIFAMAGCTSDYNGEPVDYGPPVPITDVLNALVLPSKEIDPTQMKEGAFVHFQTVQIIGANEIYSVISDTGQTIKQRHETDAQVIFSLEEEKYSYKQGQKADHYVRDFTLPFDKKTKTPAAPTEIPIDPTTAGTAASASASESAVKAAMAPLMAAMSGGTTRVKAQDVKVTYHNLRTSLEQAAAPASVARQAACLGLPQCQMTLHKVSFDQVAWYPDNTERIHFEFSVTPHVPQHAGFNMSALFPYYPGLFKSCVTLMVPVGDGHSKTLLNECQEVVDFLFEAAKK